MSNRILSIRVSNSTFKERARKLLYDLAHFRNLLILLINRYKELYGVYPTNSVFLYGMLTNKGYSPKKQEKIKRYEQMDVQYLERPEVNTITVFSKGTERDS